MPAAAKYDAFVGQKQPAKEPWQYKLSHDQWLMLFAFVYLFTGTLYLHFHNGMQYTTAVYALIEIVTTVGYGDLNFTGYYVEGKGDVATDNGKIFMALYVMVGLTVIAGVVMKVAEKAADGAEKAFRAKMRKAQMKASGLSEDQVKGKFGDRNKLVAAIVAFAAMVLFGTVFYGTYESCTCSYGRTEVPGCDPLNCEANGYKKSYVDAFYMSCITLTTVGFGDFAPKTELGRAVACVWMLVGVVVTTNLIGEITSTFLEAAKERKNYARISYDTFGEIDVDGNGTLSKYEFVSFVILQYGLVKKEDLDEIIKMYEQLDTSGDGVVTYEDIEAFQEHLQS
jgi:potassium channel subfamily K